MASSSPGRRQPEAMGTAAENVTGPFAAGQSSARGGTTSRSDGTTEDRPDPPLPSSCLRPSGRPAMISMIHDDYAARPSRESVLQRLSEALLRRSLTQIDLSQRGLQPSDARLVRMALSQNANLAVLKLGYNNLGDAGAIILAGGIATHRSLNLLDLGFNNIGDDGTRAMASAMREASRRYDGGSLHTLYLAGNLIGEDGAMALADFIRVGRGRLHKLYMTGNRLGGDGVKAITDALLEEEVRTAEAKMVSCMDEAGLLLLDEAENPAMPTAPTEATAAPAGSGLGGPLSAAPSSAAGNSRFVGMQQLFLGGTRMGPTGCQAVARLLERTSCLQVISLPNCDIGDDEIAMLALGIKANKTRLPVTSIQLSFNNISHKGLESLTNALWGSTTLRELEVDNNEIGDRGAHHVAAIIPTMNALEVLDVGFNSIKAPGLNVLMKTVAQSQHLLSLSVSGNVIDVNAAKAVAYALAYNCSLESLYLVHCSIDHEGHRHISAGIVSNSRTALRKLTGFEIGSTIVTLGFPDPLRHWTNEQVLNFVHLMWDDSDPEEPPLSDLERDLDPLSFLQSPGRETPKNTNQRQPGPLEATVVVEVAKRAFESLVANGVDVFSRRPSNLVDPSFGSPIASDAIILESSPDSTLLSPAIYMNGHSEAGNEKSEYVTSMHLRSFVAPPECQATKQQAMPDPARKKRIVEWLCANIQYLNELAELPFSSRELWNLHQHYFTPVVNESGGSVLPEHDESLVVSSVPEVDRLHQGASAVTPSTASVEDQLSVPMSDPVLAVPAPFSMSMLKRKVSYRFIGDAMPMTQSAGSKMEKTFNTASVAMSIEHGHTGHSLPPKTKRARRNRTRISFLPRIKAKLDSYLDVCHEKALITMRQLYFVEASILAGHVNPLEPLSSHRTHLSGMIASEAEMIVVDMI